MKTDILVECELSIISVEHILYKNTVDNIHQVQKWCRACIINRITY